MCRSAMKNVCCTACDTSLACALYAQDVEQSHGSCVQRIECVMLLVLRGQHQYTPWCIGPHYNAGAEEEKAIWLFVHDHSYHDVFIQQTMELLPTVQDEETSDIMTFWLMPNGKVSLNTARLVLVCLCPLCSRIHVCSRFCFQR